MRRSALVAFQRRASAAIYAPSPGTHTSLLSPLLSPTLLPTTMGKVIARPPVMGAMGAAARRWYAVGGPKGISGPFAVPHPKRTETLRFPAKAVHKAGCTCAVHGGDPLAPQKKTQGPPAGAGGGGVGGGGGSGGSGGGGGPPVLPPVLDTAFSSLKWVVLLMAVTEAALWASVEWTKPESEEQTVENWSATKEVACACYVQPEDVAALEKAVEWAHVHRRRLRPVGSALSPNGAAFNPEGMLSLALLDQLVAVDAEKMTVTVQAGARVREVVEALRPHGRVPCTS
jgi:hypothetical protein